MTDDGTPAGPAGPVPPSVASPVAGTSFWIADFVRWFVTTSSTGPASGRPIPVSALCVRRPPTNREREDISIAAFQGAASGTWVRASCDALVEKRETS